MPETLYTLTESSVAALKRDHERLRHEVYALKRAVNAIRATQDEPLIMVCVFILIADLDTSDLYGSATLNGQLGYGRRHLETSITVYNHPTDTSGVYEYSGVTGAVGKAFWDDLLKRWHIFDLQCP